jgi:hypothetical protein
MRGKKDFIQNFDDKIFGTHERIRQKKKKFIVRIKKPRSIRFIPITRLLRVMENRRMRCYIPLSQMRGKKGFHTEF